MEKRIGSDIPEQPAWNVGRRAFLGALGALVAAGESSPASAVAIAPSASRIKLHKLPLTVVDLTNRLAPDKKTAAPNSPRLSMESVDGSGVKVGMLMHRLSLIEHTGTHIDAPAHFDKAGRSLGEIPVSDLVVPLAIVDVRSKAASNPDYGLAPDDILAWEKEHGRLPDGCCVAMLAGHVTIPAPGGTRPQKRYRGFPGFSPEVSDFLMKERNVKGIGSEAGSIDQGTNGPAYPVHQEWLRSGRWGLEGMTNLDQVPAVGALLVVGAAPIVGATGIPVRLIALF
jgi:kynurenine formamidase